MHFFLWSGILDFCCAFFVVEKSKKAIFSKDFCLTFIWKSWNKLALLKTHSFSEIPVFQSWNSAKLNCCEYPNKWTNFLAPQTSGISISQNKIFVPLWPSLLLLSQLNRPQLRNADFTPMSMQIHIFYFNLFPFVYPLFTTKLWHFKRSLDPSLYRE